MDNCLEIEEKYLCLDPKEIERKLQNDLHFDQPAVFYETDVYYVGRNNSFLGHDNGLRIRSDNEGYCEITVKQKDPILNDSRSRIERNLCFNPDQHEFVSDMLNMLGFIPYCTVKKERHFYCANEDETEIHIAVDMINNLYSFVEVEIISKDLTDSINVKNKLETFLNKTGLNQLQRATDNNRDFIVKKNLEKLHITKETTFNIDKITLFDSAILEEAKKQGIISTDNHSTAYCFAQIGDSLYLNGIKIEYPNALLKQIIWLKSR